MTTIESVDNSPSIRVDEGQPFWSRIGLLRLAGLMLVVAAAWRIVDVFILQLGNTWINIMPSKLFPFLIIFGLFLRYRRAEVSTVLGLSRAQLRIQLVVGSVIGCSMYVMFDIVPSLVFGTLFDQTYFLSFTVLYLDILWYQFIFFATNALLEETLFRGLIQNGLRLRFTPNMAIVISALAFGIWHLCWPIVNADSGNSSSSETVSLLVFSVILGLFFGLYYEKFSSRVTLTGPIVVHTLINFLNEDFKLGLVTSIQGPDFALTNPVLMSIMLVFALVTLSGLIKLVSSTKVEQIQSWWSQSIQHVMMGISRLVRERTSSESGNPSNRQTQSGN
jgi:CAAX protease family protein